MFSEDASVSTNTSSRQKKDLENSSRVLTQEELLKWWPFTRLDPKRFPKAKKTDPLEDVEEALL